MYKYTNVVAQMEQTNHIQKDFGIIGCFHNNYKVYKPTQFDQAHIMGWKMVAECAICKKRVCVDKEAEKEIYIYDW